MGRRFCYRCGAGEEFGPLIDGLCQRCYAQVNPLMRAPGKVSVTICKGCGSYRVGKSWRASAGIDHIGNAMVDAALSALRFAVSYPGGVREVPLEQAPGVRVEAQPLPERRVVRVVVRGRVHELQREVTEEATIVVKVETGICEACRLRKSGRYEAIVQVRGDLSPRRIQEVRKVVDETVNAAGSGVFVSRVVELKEGIDFYVHPAGIGRQIARRIKSALDAEMKESAKLVGQTKDGMKRYRSTFLVRL